MEAKPHQEQAHRDVIRLIESGAQRVCVTSPTGGGKSYMQRRLLRWGIERGWNVQLITNRRALLEQTSVGLESEGIEHGIRASGYVSDFEQAVQLSSIQTEHKRIKTGAWSAHDAQLIVVDEAHQETEERMVSFVDAAVARGAHVVGYTATPCGIGHIYKELVVAGTNSELRACGLHVPCLHYGPDEPDMRNYKPNTKTGEYSEGDKVKAIMTPTVFGRVYDHFNRLNRDKRPTLLFGPDVKGSMYFAEQFTARGVRAAHVDGEHIWLDGKLYETTPELRAEVIQMSKEGALTVICNRFVFREGLDLPWLAHAIAATVFGTIATYLQSGGRLLRAYPGLDQVVWQDHGGNYWRHGSLNADREWHLDYGRKTANDIRNERLREKEEPEPISCPVCFFVRASGKVCPQCGHEHTKKSRMVVQTNGRLVPFYGDIFKPRVVESKPNTQKLWEQMYYRAKRSRNGMTFEQAYALFYKENRYYPPRDLDLMPVEELSWGRKVRDVRYAELRKCETDAQYLFS